MTKKQATMLSKRIAKEMPDIEVAQRLRGKSWWVLDLEHKKMRRRMSILNVDEWQSVKMAWQG